MKYNGIIENKLRLIEQKLEEINSWNIDSFEKLNGSTLLQNATERALQVAIELMIEISERILALNKVPSQVAASSNFIKLQEIGVIKQAGKYIDMVKFRNFIVHRYEKIDLEIVYGIIKKKLNLFSQFIEDIRSQ